MTQPDSTGARTIRDVFNDVAKWCAGWMGSPSAFIFSVVIVLVWAGSGPLFKYSDTWQLVINTGTTVLTFLAVFLIQNTQNRDAKAIQLKLDELIRAVEGARDNFVDLEALSDEELEKISTEFSDFRAAAQRLADQRKGRTGAPLKPEPNGEMG